VNIQTSVLTNSTTLCWFWTESWT